MKGLKTHPNRFLKNPFKNFKRKKYLCSC